MIRHVSIALLGLSLFFISACGDNTESHDVEYESTKKMVVDILQTEDGKKAVKEILADDEIQDLLIMESGEVKEAVNEALSSEEAQKNWKKMFQDPEFIKTYAKSISEEQKELMKGLMNDSQFQEQMIEILNNPEVDKQMLSIMTSQAFRAHLEKTIQETLQSPLFQEKIEKALEDVAKKKSSDNSSGENNQDSSGKSESENENENENEDSSS